MKKIKKIIYLIFIKRKKDFLILSLLSIFMLLIEALGIFSILPLISILSNSEIIFKNLYLNTIFLYLNNYGINDVKSFTIFLAIIFLLIQLLSFFIRTLTSYSQITFCMSREHSISYELTKKYLSRPYTWFLEKHSSTIIKNITQEVSIFIQHGLIPFINIITYSILIFILGTLIFIINPYVGLFGLVTFGFLYLIIFLFFKKRLELYGHERKNSNRLRLKLLNEAFGDLKQIKVNNLEIFTLSSYSKYLKSYVKSNSNAQTISLLPKFLIEFLIFSGTIFVILINFLNGENLSSQIPLLSFFAFASYRLLPSFQIVYNSITLLQFVGPALDTIYAEIKTSKNNYGTNIEKNNKKFIKFDDKISIKI